MLTRAVLRFASSKRVQTSKKATGARRFASAPAAAAPLQKAETGLCGFPVQPAGREILTKLYENILAKLGEMEASAPYRVHMTRILNHRLDILRTTENILDIEAKIEDGQIEELIDDAEDELNMLPSYIESKMWQAPNKWHTIPVTWSNLKD